MKKLIYSMAVLATMLFASCQQQELPEPVPQESTVTYTVELPGVQTKAIGDGLNINQLVYEVWKTEADNERDLKDATKATRLYQKTVPMIEDNGKVKTIISLNLVQDQSYTVLFWAQCVPDGKQSEQGASEYYNTDNLTAVTYKNLDENGVPVNYSSNNEEMAAFYSAEFLTSTETDTPDSKKVELRRPFAQLNIATKNTSDEYKIDMKRSRVTISDVPTVFDVAWNQVATPEKDAVSGVTKPVRFVFGYDNVPSDPSKIMVNNQEYEYVAMNYIFASDNVTVEYNIKAELTPRNLDGTDGSATTKAVINNTVSNVPLKENYRTNIVGNLLTHTTDYEVIVDAGWDDIYDEDLNGDGIVVEVWDQKYLQEPPKNANGEYEISLASELAWLAAAVNGTLPETKADTQEARTFSGETFVLKEDVDLSGALWTPIGATGKFLGTFDGNSKTISNMTVKTTGKTSAGLFANARNVKNVTVKDAVIESQYKTGVIVGDGLCARIENCHVDGATVIVTPYNKDEANNVGGIVGYLSSEPEAYVKDCSVQKATIKAVRKVAAIAGAANNTAVVENNEIANVTIIADQTVEYVKDNGKDYDGNAGPVVGWAAETATVATSNTVGEGVVVKRYVDSTEEMAHAVADAQDGETIYVGAGEVELPHFENKALNFTGVNESAAILEPVSGHENAFWQGSELNFTDLKIKGTSYTGKANGYVKSAKETYTNCKFVDGYYMFAGDVVTVDNGVFTGKYNSYFWTGSADEITFNGCEFNGVERIVKVCTVGHTGVERKVTFNDCQFTATELKKAAIEIDGTKGSSYIVNINNCTETGFAEGEYTGETMFNVEGTENVTVYLDGSKWKGNGLFEDEEGNKTVTKSEALKEAVTTENAVVKVLAGEYTFPSSIAEGVTIECAEGTVFTGTSKLNINGAEVIGATFSNPSGTVVDQTINGTFKNCTFTGKNAVRWSYSGDTCVFEDCVFDGETYGFHSDGGSNPITFIRCSFSGFNAFAGAIPMVTFEDCVFKSNGKSGYNGANLWGSATFKNTKFMFDGSASNEWIDCIGTDKSYEFTGCTIGTDGSLFQPELIFSRNNGTNVTIDGKGYTWIGYFADAEGNTYVTNVADLQTVVDNAPVGNTTIHILNNLAGDATVAQKPDVKLVIDGNYKNYDGMITVDGKSATYTTAGLTIKDLTFNAQAISGDACIRLGNGTNATRYTCNVTVDNCTFDVPGAVGVKSYTGGDKNLTITGCTATTNAHSLVQAKGIDGILIEKCNVYSKNGLNFNNSTNVIVNECNADVRGYAARFGEGSAATGAAETYSIKNSTLKSACEEANDAVIVLRGTADNSTLTIENTTLEGTRQIINNATGSRVIFDGKDYVCTADGLTAALANKDVKNIVLMPGTYKGTFAIGNAGTTIDGSNNAAVVDCINLNGADNVTIKNITFDAAGAEFAVNGSGSSLRYANILTGTKSLNPNKGSRDLVIDGCRFVGKNNDLGSAIVFGDQNRKSGQSGNITIKNCSFENESNAYDIYGYYFGYEKLVIEGNVFNSNLHPQGKSIYLGQYQSSTPVQVKGNEFKQFKDVDSATYIQPHSSGNYTVSFDASDNTFAE